jgi:peptide/nickel transport system substrate-binding protein
VPGGTSAGGDDSAGGRIGRQESSRRAARSPETTNHRQEDALMDTPDRPGGFHIEDMTRRSLLKRAGSGLFVVSAGGLIAACGSSSSSGTTAAKGGGTPQSGGTLTLGASGGSNNDVLEAQNPLTNCDYARGYALYNGLTTLNKEGQVVNQMAESLEPNSKGDEWTIKLKPGIMCHNGEPFTAKDILYSFSRILKNKFPGEFALGPINLAASKAVDATTAKVVFHAPYGILPEQLALIYCWMVPEGYDPKKPVGTGPFKYESFTPGQQSTFVKWDHYYQSGKPYLDKLVIVDISDETSQVNALQAGQVDAIDYLSASSLNAAKAAGAETVIAKTGAWGPFTMRVDTAPFNSQAVRNALKYVINRQQMLEQVFGGYGTIGNDVIGIFDPDFVNPPQREQDIEKAKGLLKEAGHSELNIELITTANAPGQVQAAQVFATQAKAAGVNTKITVQNPTDYFAKSYLKVPFSQDYWPYQPYLVAVSQDSIAGAPFSATHFNNPKYNELFKTASQTVDKETRKTAIHEMINIEYEQGGNIIPYHFPVIDAFKPKVKGVEPSVIGVAMGGFNWSEIWIES